VSASPKGSSNFKQAAGFPRAKPVAFLFKSKGPGEFTPILSLFVSATSRPNYILTEFLLK